MYRMYRSIALLSLLALTACGSSTGTRGALLTQEQVSGVYSACSLIFQPTGLPSVDLLAIGTERNPAPPLPTPNLKLSRQVSDFELEYTPRGDVLPRRFTGRYVLGTSRVTLEFAATPQALGSALLLPANLTMEYQASSGEMLVSSPRYTVAREDYGRFAGLSEEQMRNLQPRIEGILTGRFTRGPCS
ncbi:hypothetical protein BH23GEM6_BH23GEM6_04060 [soil metagenome]